MNIENELVKTGTIIRFFADIEPREVQEWVDGANLIGASALAGFLEDMLKLPAPGSELDDFIEEAEEALSFKECLVRLLAERELKLISEEAFQRQLQELANA